MYKQINEAEVLRTWSPIIQETTGIEDKSKLAWLSKYAHFHELNESIYNTVHLNPDMNVPGMGAVTLPGDPTTLHGFSGQAAGSGDKPYSLLPLAMQVAAQTIGLDLVPVIPMPGPLGILTYLDFVYAGGKLDSKESPFVVKVDVSFTTAGGLSTFTAGTTYFVTTGSGGTDCLYAFTYLGDSRIDGYSIFRVLPTDNDGTLRSQGATALQTINTAISTGSLYTAVSGTEIAEFSTTAELVKALEDHVEGFSGRSLTLGDGSTNKNDPYTRGEGESEPDNLMGLSLYNKSVEAKTYQVAANVTREQIQDLKQYGVDAIAQVESVLINELTQSINKLILERLFRLGATNHTNSGVNLNLNYGSSTVNIDLGIGEDGNAVPLMSTEAVNIMGGETQGSAQRRILSKILAASNVIAIRGRRGAANFAVTNGQVATALQDIAGFVPYPMSNTVNQSGGSLYPVGAVAGVNVYVDPNMNWTDTRVIIGRKGDANSTGSVFMPYMMADSVQAIAEGTMSPKIAVKSRFTLVDAGHHPETNYITIKVQVGSQLPYLV